MSRASFYMGLPVRARTARERKWLRLLGRRIERRDLWRGYVERRHRRRLRGLAVAVLALFATVCALPARAEPDCVEVPATGTTPERTVCTADGFARLLDSCDADRLAARTAEARVVRLEAELAARVQAEAERKALPEVVQPFPWGVLGAGVAGGAIVVLLVVVAAR